jgi:hypothetical protein
MATIHGTIQFGVRVKIKSPLTPDANLLKTIVGQAESKLTSLLSSTVGAALKFLPGVSAEISDAKTAMKIEKIDP